MSSLRAPSFDMGNASRSAALSLLLYDYLMTFDAEVNYVWRQRKCTWSFWLYMFNRFFPIAWILFASIALTFDNVLTKVILQMRVYALYELSKRLRYLLLVGCIAELGTMVALVPSSVVHFARLHGISTATGCYYASSTAGMTMFWIPALVFEPMLCLLVAWKAWGAAVARLMRVRKPRVREVAGVPLDFDEVPPLATIMARDSLVYFLGIYSVMVAITIAVGAEIDEFLAVVQPYVQSTVSKQCFDFASQMDVCPSICAGLPDRPAHARAHAHRQHAFVHARR
ncbi:hypothetical protein FA95DRAFT_1567752 [Auriscalpium vulgare]|uniref:Uncharacterized protein n=1 Tax=Auriscalpium vulgare TaxID=40419 RepID=A0ACB8R4G1_9AGAM|nr:hypothetical protein FA95DRAFT_1567752 [Auriscalpium vulgare]